MGHGAFLASTRRPGGLVRGGGLAWSEGRGRQGWAPTSIHQRPGPLPGFLSQVMGQGPFLPQARLEVQRPPMRGGGFVPVRPGGRGNA